MNKEDAIASAKRYLGEEYFSDLSLSYREAGDPSFLKVSKNGGKATIEYGRLASFFFGLTLIKQHHKEEAFEIELHRHFKTNGLMHDCSRNGPLNLNQAKEMILVSALFGLNRFLLYTEDVYEIKGEPYFGYLRGKYSIQELKELSAYAKAFGVELVPCIQTLSHLYGALKWPVYDPVRDTWNTLLVNEPKTYELIDKMLQSCEEAFDTHGIHIGMDEAFDIASGPFIWKNQVLDKKELLLTHLRKVVELCQKHHFRPMMWADMFFKLEADPSNGPVNWYDFQGYLSERVESLIPDVGLVYWDYYHKEREVYDRMLKACKHTGKEVIFADGAISWIGFAPNIAQSFLHTRCGLESALRNGVENVFITSWGDNGNECSVVASYPTMALHSVYDFYGKGSDRRVSGLLETVTGDPLSRWLLLQEINNIGKDREQAPFENLSKAFLYQDVLLGVADGMVKEEYSTHFEKTYRQLRRGARASRKYGYVYETLAALSKLLIHKATIGVRMRKAYQNGDKEALKGILSELRICSADLRKFLEAFRKQWRIENKPFGFDVIDGRLGFLGNRLATAYLTLRDYLEGRSDSIPELEEEILPWHGLDVDEPTLIGNWTELASVNNY